MRVRKLLKYFLGSKINASLSSLWHKSSQKTLILNLHRVESFDKSLWPPLPVDIFLHALELIESEFVIVDINDDTKYKRPSLVLSFDDGYYDFYQNVMPIISEKNFKVNHNVIPKCVESGMPPLNVTIQDFAGRESHTNILSIDWGFDLTNCDNPKSAILNWTHCLKKLSVEKQDEIEKFLIPQLLQKESFHPTKMMSATELLEIDHLVHFGNHSYSHATMTSETLDFFKADFFRSQKWFNTKLKVTPDTYAFPNGAAQIEHLDILENLGMKNVLLVGNRSSKNQSRVRQRVNFSPQNIKEVNFDLIRPVIRI